MSKSTAAEIATLQAGGNQRAREMYFKHWDPSRQSFPDRSNPEKLRDFIEAVYVHKVFAGDKPPQKGRLNIKYGVVGMDNVVQDIFTWNSLYISGRLQKPVNVLVDNAGLAIANKVNLQAAVSTALLLLPETFSEEDLYVMIASLSYMGDIRLFFAEDRNKVRSIVQGSGKNFHKLYRTPLCHAAASGMLYLPNTFGDECPALLSQDCSNHAVRELVTSLPSHLLKGLSKQLRLRYGSSGCMVADAFVKSQTNRPRILKRAIGRIVRLSSFRQMASGFFAAGGLNAFHYVSRKISKAWNSRLRG